MRTLVQRIITAMNSAEQAVAFWHRRALLSSSTGARHHYCKELDNLNELRALLDMSPINVDPRITN